jgi:hypothetical protein
MGLFPWVHDQGNPDKLCFGSTEPDEKHNLTTDQDGRCTVLGISY